MADPNPNLALFLKYMSGDCGCLALVAIMSICLAAVLVYA